MSREHITMLEHMRGTGGATRLLAGTRSRLYCNTGSDNNWRIILDGTGGTDQDAEVPAIRWKCAQVGATVVFVNGVDRPQWFSFEKPEIEHDGNACEPIDDLIALGISTARVVASWKGFVFIGNTVTEGTINLSRIYWSDFNAPLDWIPGPESLAGFVDLGSDERIMAMAPIAGKLRIYTDKAIYDANLVGGEEIFNFREIYRGPKSIQFENSLVSTGDDHYYGGRDSIYRLNAANITPDIPDWLYGASGAIFNGLPSALLGGLSTNTLGSFGKIHKSYCQTLVGGYDEATGYLWYSWANVDDEDGVPSTSIVLVPDQERACLVDHGFTAFCAHTASYQESTRSWLGRIGVCDPLPMIKEGNPDSTFVLDSSLNNIINADEDLAYEAIYDASYDSLCYKIGYDSSIDPNCLDCGNAWVFVMASAADKCLKQYEPDVYYRESCELTDDESTGLDWTIYDHPTTSATYERDGYCSLLQTDSMQFGTSREKTVQKAVVDCDVDDNVDSLAAYLHCDVGYGAQPGRLMWQESEPRRIDELSGATDVEHEDDNTRPGQNATFYFHRRGHQIGMRLIVGRDTRYPVTGGRIAINAIDMKVRKAAGDYL